MKICFHPSLIHVSYSFFSQNFMMSFTSGSRVFATSRTKVGRLVKQVL